MRTFPEIASGLWFRKKLDFEVKMVIFSHFLAEWKSEKHYRSTGMSAKKRKFSLRGSKSSRSSWILHHLSCTMGDNFCLSCQEMLYKLFLQFYFILFLLNFLIFLKPYFSTSIFPLFEYTRKIMFTYLLFSNFFITGSRAPPALTVSPRLTPSGTPAREFMLAEKSNSVYIFPWSPKG